MFALWLLDKLNPMILAASRDTWPFDSRVIEVSKPRPHGSCERRYTTPLDPELRCSSYLSSWALIKELNCWALCKLSYWALRKLSY